MGNRYTPLISAFVLTILAFIFVAGLKYLHATQSSVEQAPRTSFDVVETHTYPILDRKTRLSIIQNVPKEWRVVADSDSLYSSRCDFGPCNANLAVFRFVPSPRNSEYSDSEYRLGSWMGFYDVTEALKTGLGSYGLTGSVESYNRLSQLKEHPELLDPLERYVETQDGVLRGVVSIFYSHQAACTYEVTVYPFLAGEIANEAIYAQGMFSVQIPETVPCKSGEYNQLYSQTLGSSAKQLQDAVANYIASIKIGVIQ